MNDTEKTNELMEYVDYYCDPTAIIKCYGQNVTLGEVRTVIENAF
jgi:hypothetical protein